MAIPAVRVEAHRLAASKLDSNRRRLLNDGVWRQASVNDVLAQPLVSRLEVWLSQGTGRYMIVV